MEQNYEKMKIALRYWLHGKGYTKALEAMALAEKIHNGKRKDGSPEFSHQVSMVSYAITITCSFKDEEDLICILFLHDAPEDYDLSYWEMENKFGAVVADGAMKMSKICDGSNIGNITYYDNLGKSALTSIAKGS